MLIGLCGGICAGKHAIAEYLIQQGFQLLELADKSQSHIAESGDDLRLQASEIRKKMTRNRQSLHFKMPTLYLTLRRRDGKNAGLPQILQMPQP
ncbi:uncharacterized protein N7500_000186 [Penicillium coprophilum]|uniref:uncharacterized protein n=1 Tax=Penicillium coprophilum TaxID=36646 RepID=UPI0023942149|nr:uncharacterized protein N7500_000186 [Penicillium coprophilum]KAJ5177487.1 hypothetical protein N7500_000186 [Penicillium coprophilum]